MYPILHGKKFRLSLIGDSSLLNVDDKYAQQGWFVLLEEVDTETGGLCHILDFGSRKSGRDAHSSFKAESIIAAFLVEMGQKIGKWLTEIWEGAESAKELEFRNPALPSRLWTDAYDLFSTLRCPLPYRGKDGSAHLIVESIKEEMKAGRLDEVGWTPTSHMVADSLTKWKSDVLIGHLMDSNRWVVEGYELFDARMIFDVGEGENVECNWFACYNCEEANCRTAVFFMEDSNEGDDDEEAIIKYATEIRSFPKGPKVTLAAARFIRSMIDY